MILKYSEGVCGGYSQPLLHVLIEAVKLCSAERGLEIDHRRPKRKKCRTFGDGSCTTNSRPAHRSFSL
jgi:hypothetical protein